MGEKPKSITKLDRAMARFNPLDSPLKKNMKKFIIIRKIASISGKEEEEEKKKIRANILTQRKAQGPDIASMQSSVTLNNIRQLMQLRYSSDM